MIVTLVFHQYIYMPWLLIMKKKESVKFLLCFYYSHLFSVENIAKIEHT